VNRLRKIGDDVQEEDRGTHRSVFPDTRRIVQGIEGKRTADDGRVEYAVRNDDPLFGMRSVWVAAENLPPIVLAMVQAPEDEGREWAKRAGVKRKMSAAELNAVLAANESGRERPHVATKSQR